MFSLSDNKAPDTSGLTPAYYKEIWEYTGTLITNAINDCQKEQKIPETQRKGAIVLIPKSGKDQRYISNLRLITLLNTFYKLISEVLTTRMKPILQRIIAGWQKAYLRGRFIGEITRGVYDIFNYANHNNTPGFLLLIDFSKAFDSTSHEYIKNTMKVFNFFESFID